MIILRHLSIFAIFLCNKLCYSHARCTVAEFLDFRSSLHIPRVIQSHLKGFINSHHNSWNVGHQLIIVFVRHVVVGQTINRSPAVQAMTECYVGLLLFVRVCILLAVYFNKSVGFMKAPRWIVEQVKRIKLYKKHSFSLVYRIIVGYEHRDLYSDNYYTLCCCCSPELANCFSNSIKTSGK